MDGGFLFAMCSATDTIDIALAATGIEKDAVDGLSVTVPLSECANPFCPELATVVDLSLAEDRWAEAH